MGEESPSQPADSAKASSDSSSSTNQLQNTNLLLLLSISSVAGIVLSFAWDGFYGPVFVGIVTCFVAHFWVIPLEAHSEPLLPSPQATPTPAVTSTTTATASQSAPTTKSTPPTATAPASATVPGTPTGAAATPATGVTPATDEAATGNYLDAQGISPGARAMAAAMKAKASRGAKAQAAAANNLVRAPPGGAATPGKADGAGDRRRMVVLYGSQTGNAAEIAKQISAEAEQRKLPCAGAFPMNEFPMDKLGGVGVAVLVASSTGDGDPPENCDRMVGSIQRKTWPNDCLAHLQYTVCGLGDSNYTRFMAIPRVFTRRLPELGAKCFYKCCEADEVDGLEEIVEKWTGDLWEPLTAALHTAASAPSQSPSASLALGEADQEKLVGVAPLQACKVRLLWQDTPTMNSSEKTTVECTKEAGDGEGVLYTHSSPFTAPVKQAQRLSSPESDRNVVHVDLSLQGWEMGLPKAGDSVGVVPRNAPALVDALLQRLGVNGDHEFVIQSTAAEGGPALSHIPSPCSLRHALSQCVDVTGVAKKGLLRVLAEYTTEKKEKHMLMLLVSRGGKEKYKEYIVQCRPGLLELLNSFASCKPDLAHLLEVLPPLTTRFYSLCCSPAVSTMDPMLSFAFSVVRQKLGAAPAWLAPVLKEGAGKERAFEGVCTTWMEEKLQGNHLLWSSPDQKQISPAPISPISSWSLSIYPRSGGSFCHPADVSAPVIMIGPGTGVAPFRGFLQEREAAVKGNTAVTAGESWLFFGCRQKDEDYLYREDLEGFVERGVLSRLVVAFSRSPENNGSKVYVQNKMEEHAEELGKLLFAPNTHVFVCGDGADMAKGVHAALLKVIQKTSNLRESESIAHMATMLNQGRYIRDVWS